MNREFVDSLMPYALEAGKATGVDPRIIVAQAALESGWGKSAPGNNYFGIKSHGQGGGQNLATTEIVNGQPVRVNDSFRQYASAGDSVADYASFINDNPRYAGLRGAQGLDAQLAALGSSGYATDPEYSNKVGAIASRIPVTFGDEQMAAVEPAQAPAEGPWTKYQKAKAETPAEGPWTKYQKASQDRRDELSALTQKAAPKNAPQINVEGRQSDNVERIAGTPEERYGSAIDVAIGQGLMLGAGDEVGAAAAVPRRLYQQYSEGRPLSVSDAYNEGLEIERARVANFSERNPIGAVLAEVGGAIGGAVASPAILGGNALANMIRGGNYLSAIGRGAVVGGAYGGVQGFNSGEGGLQNRLDNALTQLTIGAGAGGALGGLGNGFTRLMSGKANAINEANAIAQQADEFGIPLTRGQASGNLRQLTKEENLRQIDSSASPIIRNFDTRQAEAIGEAAENIGSRFGSNAENVGEMVPNAVRELAESTKASAKQKFDEAFGSNLTVNREAFNNLPTFVADRIAESGRIIDDQLTPSAARALREIQEAVQMGGALNSPMPSASRGVANEAGDIIGVGIRGVEQIRRRIGSLKGSTPEDSDATTLIKKSFDGWIDDSIDKALFSGDEAALNSLKSARKEWTEFMSMVSPKTGDDAGRIVKKMQDQDVTPVEIANWLYGANIARPSLSAPRVADRVKSLLGEDSAEWQAVRAGAWQRLTQNMFNGEPQSAAKMARNIFEFTNARGSSLAKAMFSQDERDLMRRFATTLERTVTPRDAMNPSRTGHTMAKMVEGIQRAIFGGIGFAADGVTGGAVGVLGVPASRNVSRGFAARKAVKPLPQNPRVIDAERGTNLATIGTTNLLSQ